MDMGEKAIACDCGMATLRTGQHNISNARISRNKILKALCTRKYIILTQVN